MPWASGVVGWAAPRPDQPPLLRVRPSETCGPFRGMETIYVSGKTWVQVMEKSVPNISWLTWAPQRLLENTFLLFFLSGVLL